MATYNNFGAVVSDVLDRMWGSSSDATQLARAKRLVNRAYQDVCRHPFHWLYKPGTISLTDASEYGSCPSDCQRVITMAETTQNRKLKYMSRKVYDNLYPNPSSSPGTGYPIYYIPAGLDTNRYLRYEFSPAAAQDTTIQLWYLQKISDMSNVNTSYPLVPEMFHEVIVWGALMRAQEYMNNPTLYAVAKSEYEKLFRDMVAHDETYDHFMPTAISDALSFEDDNY